MQTTNKTEQAGLGLADFAALYQMSMRSFFWKIDGRQGLKQLGKESENSAIAMAFYFMALIIAYGPMVCLIGGVLTLHFYMIPFSLIYMVLLSPVVFNFPRLKYNLRPAQPDQKRPGALRRIYRHDGGGAELGQQPGLRPGVQQCRRAQKRRRL